MSWTGFQPAGHVSPIGFLKSFSRCHDGVHFDPYQNGGSVFHDQHSGNQRWVYLDDPTKHLRMPLAQAIRLIESCVVNGDINYNWINGGTPANWGATATYIEFVPRFFGGILGMIRLLSAIPAAHRGTFPCVMLRNLLNPTEGNGLRSYYGLNLTTHGDDLDPDLFQGDLECGNFTDRHMLIRAFNDLAHARGIKTGFCVIVNDGQIYLDGRQFNWRNQYDRDVFFQKILFLLNLGFDAIHVDSGKHIGGYNQWGGYNVWDRDNYHGVGDPIPYEVFKGFAKGWRWLTNRPISIVCEYGDDDDRYRDARFNSGIDADIDCMDADAVKRHCISQAWKYWYRKAIFINHDTTPNRNSEANEGPAYKALRDQPPGARVPVWMNQSVLFPLATRSFHDLVLYPIRWHHDGGHFHPRAAESRFRINETFACGT